MDLLSKQLFKKISQHRGRIEKQSQMSFDNGIDFLSVTITPDIPIDHTIPRFNFEISSSSGTQPVTLLKGQFFSENEHWLFSHLHQSNYTISAELANYFIEKNINASVIKQEHVKAKLNRGTKLLNSIINPHTQFSK